ncbi:MAG: hypothetical protein HGB26_07680, partial [Desulfobulbaceae bacterium]|nr:hypothetical protein [Desulfobulbaceae bacterium]
RAALDSGIAAEAVVALEVVVRVTPENLEAQRLLAELYAAAGKQAAAAKCLVLAASLDLEPPPVAPEKAVAAPLEEEVPEADIIELSDEFIEVEGVTDTTNPFAALPDRPSLGEDFVRAEPYLIKTVPPAAPAAMEPQETAAPAIASATIAELYISQGFPDKGVEMYRELLASDPRNELYQRRLTELVPPPVSAAGIQTTASSESVLDKLQEWLANIGRVREWRTKSF